MPTYTLPRSNTQSTDNWAEAAKMFLSSPSYANQYMDEANSVYEAANAPFPTAIVDDFGSLSDRDMLAGILTAEGGNRQDMEYIADVIQNRAASSAYPGTYRDVILQPGQFSAINDITGYAGGEGANDHWRTPTADAYAVADAFLTGGGSYGGGTGGALNYYNPTLASPAWGGAGFRRLPGSAHVFGTAG